MKRCNVARSDPTCFFAAADAEWMAAAQAALKKNKSTFAMQWIDGGRLNSFIAKFRELGYEIEEPRGTIE